MGLRDAFDRSTREMLRKTAFKRDERGRLVFIPGGSDNPMSWHVYLVPDEATAERVETRYLPGYRAWIVSLLALLALLGALAVWTPPGLHPVLLIALVPVTIVAQAWLPLAIGRRIAREMGLTVEPRKRSLGQIADSMMGEKAPPALLWFLSALCLSFMAFALYAVYEALRRGEPQLALFLGVLSLPIVFIGPAYFLAIRERRIRAANARLEGVVHERTVQLREANARLQARVAEQVAHMERLGQLRHFFAAPVAELILGKEGFDLSRLHRKELSVVSMDLRGFTAFSETAEPEEVIRVLRAYHTKLGEVVNKYSATLEHFAGESAMIFLNDPLDLPDHPRRALAMAVDMRVAVQPLIDEWRRLGYDLGWSAGIATGFATIGTVGYEGRWEYAAIGSVNNLSARLCAKAGDGQVVTTHRVISRAGEGVELEPLGDLVMKGISRPVAGFNVVAVA
jgi:class 3 adenylate cyclase